MTRVSGDDQLVNNAAKLRYMSGGQLSLPLVVRAPCGATTRGAQHGQSPEAYFLQASGLKIAVPATPYDAKGLLKTAIRDENPVLFFEHKRLYGSSGRGEDVSLAQDVPDEEYVIPFGTARVCREGRDVTIVATMLMVHEALAAADMLAEGEIFAEVVDLRTLVPLDIQTVFESVQKTSRLVIVEENPFTGGWGANLAARVAGDIIDALDAPIRRVTCPDTPVPFSPPLEKAYVPDRQRIFAAVLDLFA